MSGPRTHPDRGLLDPSFLARLERLTLQARRLYAGREAGERRSPRRGTGLEFAGHRGYVAGDDLRHLDWPLLGRLGRPYIREYEQQEDLSIHLLVDTSRSMEFGDKLGACLRMAAALAHVGLSSLDRVGAALFDGDGLRVHPPSRGRGALFPLLRFLEGAEAEGSSGGEQALRLHASGARPGLTVVFSDFLDPDFPAWIRPLRLRRHTLALVQVLSRDELEPDLEGDLRLVDAETGSRMEVTVGRRERQAYLDRLEAHQKALRELGARYEADVFMIPSDLPLERAVWDELLGGTFLRA